MEMKAPRKRLAKAILAALQHDGLDYTSPTSPKAIPEGDVILIEGELAIFDGTSTINPTDWQISFPITSDKAYLPKGVWSVFERFTLDRQSPVKAAIARFRQLDLAGKNELCETWVPDGEYEWLEVPFHELTTGDIIEVTIDNGKDRLFRVFRNEADVLAGKAIIYAANLGIMAEEEPISLEKPWTNLVHVKRKRRRPA